MVQIIYVVYTSSFKLVFSQKYKRFCLSTHRQNAADIITSNDGRRYLTKSKYKFDCVADNYVQPPKVGDIPIVTLNISQPVKDDGKLS